ncbi:conserved hypothetical protein [Paraburkholderia tropica]
MGACGRGVEFSRGVSALCESRAAGRAAGSVLRRSRAHRAVAGRDRGAHVARGNRRLPRIDAARTGCERAHERSRARADGRAHAAPRDAAGRRADASSGHRPAAAVRAAAAGLRALRPGAPRRRAARHARRGAGAALGARQRRLETCAPTRGRPAGIVHVKENGQPARADWPPCIAFAPAPHHACRVTRRESAQHNVTRRAHLHLHHVEQRLLARLVVVERDHAVLQIALRIERGLANHALVVRARDFREDLRVVGRVRALHRIDDDIHRVIGERRIVFDRMAEALLILRRERRAAVHALERHAGLRADDVVRRGARELREAFRADAVARQHLRAQAELARLLGERTAGGIHAAVHDRVRILALDLGENRAEIDGLVVGRVVRNDLHAERFRGLFELVREALAVGGRVVDHGDALHVQALERVVGERRTLLRVGGDHAVRGLEALLRIGRIRRRRRDLHDAGVAIDLRGGNRCARIQMADHGDDLVVDELLRDLGGLARVGTVVLTVERERDLLAADRQTLGVDLFDRETRAVFVVFAEVGRAARERADVTDLDHLIRGCIRAHRAEREHGGADRQQRVKLERH